MVFSLNEELNIGVVKNIWDNFLSELENSENEDNTAVAVDAEHLKKIDTAGLQLILAMKSETEYRGREWSIMNVSNGLIVNINSYGFNVGQILSASPSIAAQS